MYKDYEKSGTCLKLRAFTSTSLIKEGAEGFLTKPEDLKPGFKAIFMTINIEYSDEENYYFKMNQSKYSVYPEEEEVLLQAGMAFKIMGIKESPERVDIHLLTSPSVITLYFW